jgi:hypothetical protein
MELPRNPRRCDNDYERGKVSNTFHFCSLHGFHE